MKKMILLSALVCAGQMYGMEPEKPQSVEFGEEWKTLPNDVKPLILMALTQSGNDLDEAIKSIVKASRTTKALNQMINLNDLQGFTKIVHTLANKFNVSTQKVAVQFSTPTSKEYNRLLREAHWYAREPVGEPITNNINQLIKEGLDVNAIYSDGKSLLQRAITDHRSLDLINLLLNAGANPHYKDNEGHTALDYAKKLYSKVGTTPLDRFILMNYQPIIPLLEEAMEKQSTVAK